MISLGGLAYFSGMADEGREQLLVRDESIALPEEEKGLKFDAASDEEKYSQGDVDDILKMFQ